MRCTRHPANMNLRALLEHICFRMGSSRLAANLAITKPWGGHLCCAHLEVKRSRVLTSYRLKPQHCSAFVAVTLAHLRDSTTGPSVSCLHASVRWIHGPVCHFHQITVQCSWHGSFRRLQDQTQARRCALLTTKHECNEASP